MATCTAFRIPLVDSPMAAAKKALRFLVRRVLRLEREFAGLLDGPSTSSSNRPALAFGRPKASAQSVPMPFSLRWVIILGGCVQMQRLLLSVASALASQFG
jgi:hypothetical protein